MTENYNCKVYSWLLNNTQKSNKICGIKRNWIVICKTISRQKESYFVPQWPPMKSIIVFPYHFFPGLLFYVYIGSPNPKIPEGLTPQASNPINQKPRPQKPNLRPQSQNLKPQNHHKWAKIRKKTIKNNPGKKAWAALSFINRPCCSILATAYKKSRPTWMLTYSLLIQATVQAKIEELLEPEQKEDNSNNNILRKNQISMRSASR